MKSERNIEDEQERALSELRVLLEGLKSERNKPTPAKEFLNTFQSPLIDELIYGKKDNDLKKLDDKDKDRLANVPGITKVNVAGVLSGLLTEQYESDIDNISIYEDDPSQTKTIYRSDSYDDSQDDEVVSTGEEPDEDTSIEKSGDSSKLLNAFNNTFEIDKQELNTKESENAKFPKKTEKNDQQLANGNAKKTSNDISENFPSVGSGNSFGFDDVLTGDILGKLDDFEDSSSRKSKSSYDSKDSLADLSLNIEEDKIVNMIVAKLKNQLQPTLEKLSKESEKYELMKNVYKLPSISNLNEEVKIKYSNKGKKYNLDFDSDLIKEMVAKEMTKNTKRKTKVNQLPIISAEDQVRLNFNKYRQLNTIVEEQNSENSSLKSLESNDDKNTEEQKIYPCQRKSYSKLKDDRKIENLETDELIIFLKYINDGKLQGSSKVKHLIMLFEKHENVIKKLDNQTLRKLILVELNKRNVI